MAKMLDKETGRELIRVHIWMDPKDLEWLDQVYGETIGRSKAIRLIVAKYRKTIEEKLNQRAKPLAALDITLD